MDPDAQPQPPQVRQQGGDATITWRYTNRHNSLVASTYFFVSSYFQSDPIKAFIRKARTNNPALYRQIITQYVVWGGTHLALLALAMVLYGLCTRARGCGSSPS